jgi:serine/threonine-protein kinase
MVRFRQEAEKMAQLEHPNIVRVYAVGELNGLPFFSMELAPGGNLSQLIGGKSQSPKLTAQYGETLARAMHYAHLQNIIHRDLKPSNVVLTATGEPKITDFGLAKTVKEWTDESGAGGETRTQGEGEKSGGDGQYTGATETMRGAESAVSLPGSSCVPRNSSLTQTGVILGTPAYMSPEQAAGKSAEIGPRTDVYALGTILYEMLTGRAPFQGRSPLPIMKQVQEEDPRLPRSLNPKVDPELEAVCLKCLEKKPARRYDSADALAEDLRRWQRGERTRARPRRWIGRIRRMTRRPLFRRIVAALLIVGATYAATVALGVIQKSKPPPNPEEEAAKQEAEKRKLVFEELRRGNPVTLIDENGPLLLFPWRTNGETSKVFRTPDGSFSIQSWRTGLWELLPDPQIEKYRFNIEVRHDDNTDAANGRVGLYFSSIDYSSARGLEHCYLILAFNDLERQFPILPEGNSNDIVFKFENYCEPTMLTDSAWVLDPKKFIPAVGALSKPWRHLSVEVTPERIRVFWENNPSPIYDIDRSSLMARAKTFLRNSDIPEEIQPTFDTRGSLGLFVHRSSASFRRATVEPLAGDD